MGSEGARSCKMWRSVPHKPHADTPITTSCISGRVVDHLDGDLPDVDDHGRPHRGRPTTGLRADDLVAMMLPVLALISLVLSASTRLHWFQFKPEETGGRRAG
jgi:hypothetical protein